MSTDQSTAVICAACQSSNVANAKFCRSCGHTLYEPCGKCSASVLLDQKFCGDCGADLEKLFAKKKEKFDGFLASAVTATKASDFEHALGLLSRVAELEDFRFAESASAASNAIKQVTRMREQSEAIAKERISQAILADKEGRVRDAVQLLSEVPEKQLDDDARTVLQRNRTFIDQVTNLEKDFTEASKSKDWRLSGSLINQIHELLPDNEKYRKLGEKIADKLLRQAETRFAHQRYDSATNYLAAIPERCLTEKSQKLRQSIVDAQWMHDLMEEAPFATPALGRFAVRFAKLVSSDAQAQKIPPEIAKQLKAGKRNSRCHLPPWKGDLTSWLGGQCHTLSRPTAINFSDTGERAVSQASELLRKHQGQFNVAFGLAIQGLGKGRISGELSGRKKGLFGRKKHKACWGIDIGSHSLKAVRMIVEGDDLEVTDLFHHELDTGPTQRASASELATAVTPAIKNLMEEHDFADVAVWVNLPGSEITTRFVRLPPVSDKQASQLLENEVKERVPIARDDINLVQSVSPFKKEQMAGRAAVLTVTRKKSAEDRLAMLDMVGLKADGLQTDPLALVNFASLEFAEVFDDGEEDKSKDEANERHDEKTPTLAIVDCGATSTTLLYVSAETYWFWTVEMGGFDLDASLARSTKLTRSEAEKLKLDPVKLQWPADQYEPVQQRLDELRGRLQRIAKDAQTQNDRFDVTETWCMGGGCLPLQWIRRVILRSDG